VSKKKKTRPTEPPLEIEVTAVASPRRGAHIVTSRIGDSELHRDTFDLNNADRREKFVRQTMRAAFPSANGPKKWPAEARRSVKEQIDRHARVPPGTAEEVTPCVGEVTEGGYLVDDGHTLHVEAGRRLRLANFAARIVCETITDDGVEQTRELSISVKLAGSSQEVEVTVPAERFSEMGWVAERLGPQYVIQAGQGVKDRLRCAIQELSGPEIRTATMYRHTGWRNVDGRWVYLHGGLSGDENFGVRLEGAAAKYQLPVPPAGEELRAAVRASLDILNGLAPDHITVPLLATVYRAALGPADYALWLAGRTGVQKSELAALAQQHYGQEMRRECLPGNWSSTPNALEELAFTAKDALLVIDDFAPPASRHDADRLHLTAERLIRGQGNGAGRQRMRSDGSLRPPKPPRGLILGTGEDLPRGHSILARLFIVELHRGDICLDRLTECQRDAAAGLYAAAMAGFATWLSAQHENRQKWLIEERSRIRKNLAAEAGHARSPDMIANLLCGLYCLRRFAVDVNALTVAESEALWEKGRKAISAVADEQQEHQRVADPVEQFPVLLASVISGGFGFVALRSGEAPGEGSAAVPWGWDGITKTGHGLKIGWLHGDEVMLNQDNAYAALCQLTNRQGHAFPLSKTQLFRRLKDEGMLIGCDPKRTTCRRQIEGGDKTISVVALSLLGRKVCKVRSEFTEEDREYEFAGETG
jgi:hypothetical protein